MPVDYDLAILGGTPEGRIAAIAAAKTGARIALVEPPLAWQQQVYVDTLQQGLVTGMGSTWEAARAWAHLATYAQAERISLAAIAALGVDVVADSSAFQPGRRPTLQTAQRSLRARGYLLATGAVSQRPPIAGLAAAQPLSLVELAQRASLPRRVGLIGHQSMAVEWAFALAQAGSQVTLILTDDHFLGAEDGDIRRLLGQQLRAAGVQIVLQRQIDALQVEQGRNGPIQICVGAEQIEIDQLVLASRDRPNLDALNLSVLPLQSSSRGLRVNRWLQTEHPRIYAIGAVLGGEDRQALAAEEAQIAVHNALFWNCETVAYAYIPYGLTTPNEVGRVGLTEQQARQRYGDRAQVCHRSSVPLDATTAGDVNFCKLIYLEGSQQLVGVHLMGLGARSLVYGLAAAIQRRALSLAALARQQPEPQTLAALMHQAAQPQSNRQWQAGQWRRDWAENWFNWQRSRES
ncbi:MAG: FAD-dependent oxidoreductase [Cyanobacteria bacterium P01_A01_bin.105]